MKSGHRRVILPVDKLCLFWETLEHSVSLSLWIWGQKEEDMVLRMWLYEWKKLSDTFKANINIRLHEKWDVFLFFIAEKVSVTEGL